MRNEPGSMLESNCSPRKKWLMLLVAFFFFLLIGVLLMLPVLQSLNGNIIGTFDPICSEDLASTLWLRWYFLHNLDLLICNPSVFFNPVLLFYPWGFNTYIADGGNYIDILFTLPLSWLFGFPADFNLFILMELVLNATAAFLLLRELIGNRWICLLAAIPYGFNIFCLDEISQGRVLQAFGPFIPLAILFLLRLIKGRHVRRMAIAAAVTMVLISISYWFYGFFLIIWLVVHWSHLMVIAPAGTRRIITIRVIAALALFGALVLPFFSPFFNQLFQTGNVQGLSTDSLLTEMKGQEFISDTTNTPFEAVAGQQPAMPFFEPSILIPLLLLLPLIWCRKRPTAWLLSLAVFYILYLGPFLDISFFGVHIPMPFLLLSKFVPFFSRFLWPNRFLIMFFLFLSTCLGFSFKHVADNWPKKYNRFRVPTFFLVASLLVAPVLTGTELNISRVEKPPSFYFRLAQEPLAAVINVPLFSPASQGVAIRYQMVHGQPMLSGPNAHIDFLTPDQFKRFLKRNSFLKLLFVIDDKEASTDSVKQEDIDKLADLGFRYVLFHKFVFSSAEDELAQASVVPQRLSQGNSPMTDQKRRFRISQMLKRTLGTPVFETDKLAVFEIVRRPVH
ncbi:MAG: hypothetical protein QGH40_00965 [bacterium]|nr:hypothetical protein [bacterium]